MQIDQYSTEVINSKKKRLFPIVKTYKTLDNSYKQYNKHISNQQHINTIDSIKINHQNIPDLVLTLSAYLHYPIIHSIIDTIYHRHYLLIHSFFTIYRNTNQLAYTLTFFKVTAKSSLESIYSQTSSLV